MSQITIQNLSFTYEGDYVPVFQGLDLRDVYKRQSVER